MVANPAALKSSQRTPVLIVGGGPVGLALAGDLAWRGIKSLLVEQSDGTIYQPKMDLVSIRTMEFCRRWNIVEDVESCPYPRDYPQDNIYLTSLTGYELGREKFPAMADDRPPPASPQKRERCPQNMFDPILRAFASSRPEATLRYGARLVSLAQDKDGVTAQIEDVESGERYDILANYLAGCDGASSRVRELLGIAMTGRPVMTYTTNIIFRCANLVSLHDKGKGYRHIFLDEQGVWATIVAINGRDQWRMSIIGSSERRELSNPEIDAAIRRAVGADLDYEILTVVPWTRRELLADRYREGRCFILGDAAHVMSPTGGFGMNTGIADAVDLSWKLAAMIEGWGADTLLESFDVERRPVGRRNVAEASKNLTRMLSPRPKAHFLEDSAAGDAERRRFGAEFSESMRHEWYTLGIHLGYCYDGSPVCQPDGTVPPADNASTYMPSTRPGVRAPHVWLADGRSTLDLFGRGFVLVRLGADAPDARALADAAASRNVPLSVVDINEPAVIAAYQRRLVLVRPDGHVAWRGDTLPADPLLLVDTIRGAIPASAVTGTPRGAETDARFSAEPHPIQKSLEG